MGEPIVMPVAPKHNGVNVATLIVAILILVTVLGMLGLDIWRTFLPDADGLAGMVQTSMSEYLANDSDLSQYHPRVGTVSVMRVGQNAFEGQADISSNTGRSRSVLVHVLYDGDQMFWHTDPGAFLFMTAPS